MGTRKEMPKIPPHSRPSQKGKNWTPHESILSLSLAAWNFLFPKWFAAIKEWVSLTPSSRGKIPPTLNPLKQGTNDSKIHWKADQIGSPWCFLGVIFYHRMDKLLLAKLGKAQANIKLKFCDLKSLFGDPKIQNERWFKNARIQAQSVARKQQNQTCKFFFFLHKHKNLQCKKIFGYNVSFKILVIMCCMCDDNDNCKH